MNFIDILEFTKKPQIYAEGNAVMWTDDHISKQLLNIHLTLLSKKCDFCLDFSSKPLSDAISFLFDLLILTNKFTLKSLLIMIYLEKYI